MTGKDRILLQKMRTCIDDILQYIDELSFDDFMADKKTLAVCAFHDYENIDLEVLWGTVTQGLPDLARKIDGILNRKEE